MKRRKLQNAVEVEELSHAMLVSFVYELYQVAKRAPKTSSNIVQSFSGLELAVFISDRAVALTVDYSGCRHVMRLEPLDLANQVADFKKATFRQQRSQHAA